MKRLLFAIILVSLAACNDRSVPTISDSLNAIDSIYITPDPIEITEGEALQLQLYGLDKRGRKIEHPLLGTWTSLVPEIATVTTTGRLSGKAAGRTEIIAHYQELETRAVVRITQIPAASIRIAPSGAQLETGDTVRFNAVVLDSMGSVLPNRRVVWSSSMPSVASIDSMGTLVARAAGSTRIRAQSGSVNAYVTVEVRWAPVATLRFDLEEITLFIGDRLTLDPITHDAAGNPVPAHSITWTSDDPQIAAVNVKGDVHAISFGSTLIRARTDGVEGTVRVNVREPDHLIIDKVEPAALVPGEDATITGWGFSENREANEVYVGGVRADVLHASPSTLRFRVPDLDIENCSVPRDVILRVRSTTNDVVRVGERLHRAQSASGVTLAVGEAYQVTDAATIDCLQIIKAEGKYILAVINTSDNPNATVGFELVGETEESVVATAPHIAPPHPRAVSRDHEREARALRHAEILEDNQRLASRPHLRPRAKVAYRTDIYAADEPKVGDRITVRIPQLNDLCNQFTEVLARIVYVGEHTIILEDPRNPSAGQADAQYQAIGEEFESQMLPIIREYFGNPLAMDKDLDANGRLYMLFSKTVFDMSQGQIAGFVTSVDFMSRTSCIASNEAEIFYAVSPDSRGTPEEWHRTIRSTVIHEVKHLASYAERFALTGNALSTPLETRWLEESTAMIAEEIWARTIHGFRQYGNTDYQSSIYCELRANVPGPCFGRPQVMLDHFYFVSKYYEDVENKTPIGQADQADVTFYGSGWQFVRWAVDQYATQEANFLSELTRTLDAGVENITARAKTTFPAMMVDWALAIAADDYPGLSPARKQTSLPSWNTRDIFEGLHEDFGPNSSVFNTPFPLVMRRLSPGNFTVSVERVRAGTAAFFEFTGNSDVTQTIRIRGLGGGTTPTRIAIAILRVE